MKWVAFFSLVLTFTWPKAQREPRFKYNYTFTISIHTCPSAILKDTCITTPDTSYLEIELLDCENKPIPFATVGIKGKDSITKASTADSIGKATFNAPPGTYLTTAASIGFQNLTRTLAINSHSKHRLTIKLGRSQPLDVYDIHSKTPLSTKNIEDIKACVERNPSNPFKCSVKNAYSILMEI